MSRNANPASDDVRGGDPGRSRLRQVPHRPHGVDRLHRRAGLARRAGAARTGRSNWTRRRSCCTTRRRSSKDSRPTAGPTGRSCRFAPEANAARLRSSARRMAIPELPEELFIESLRQLIAVDERLGAAGRRRGVAVPAAVRLRHRARAWVCGRPTQYRYLVIGSPAGAYFKSGIKPVSVWLSTEYVRASPGGTGAAKFGGNYAASLLAQAEAAEQRLRPGGLAGRRRTPLHRRDGRHEPVLRVRQRRFGPAWSPRSCPVRCCPVSPEIRCCSWQPTPGSPSRNARSTSTSGRRRPPPARSPRCSPAAPPRSSRPVSQVKYGDGEFTIGDGESGEVTMALRDTLTGIQRGTFADTHGWMSRLG